ncbi:MAG TPA: ZIP family metal transporter [Blastocatellia bacterium]|nr:ZIP family metal transporter [Blastocatellia bacterium]
MPSTRVLYAIASVTLVSLVSLIGVVTISVSEERLRSTLFVLVSLAAGAMFGDTFIHLLPESFQRPGETLLPSTSVLAGILAFFVLEKFLLWRHQHTLESNDQVRPLGYLNLIADGVHNLIDGMMIGASYLVSLPIGIATTLAVIFHEIPQEIGDFGILLHAGFTKRRALFFNFLSAALALLGTAVAMLLGSNWESFSAVMLPFTAGGFIYIAGSDLLPELQKELAPTKSIVQFGALAAGIGLMLLLRAVG